MHDIVKIQSKVKLTLLSFNKNTENFRFVVCSGLLMIKSKT